MLTTLLLLAAAQADIGPPPTCPAGQHHEYLQGHRCVRDGYQLQIGPNGEVVEVAGPGVPREPTPTPVEPTPAPNPTPAPQPDPKVEPKPAPTGEKAGGCATVDPIGASPLLALLALRRRHSAIVRASKHDTTPPVGPS